MYVLRTGCQWKAVPEKYDKPYIGDYVVCVPRDILDNSEDFFNNTIGKIYNFSRVDNSYCIEYDDIPYFIKKYYCAWRQKPDGKQYLENKIWFRGNMIKYHGETKEEVEQKISADKYNL